MRTGFVCLVIGMIHHFDGNACVLQLLYGILAQASPFVRQNSMLTVSFFKDSCAGFLQARWKAGIA